MKRRTDGRMDGQTNCKKKKITVKILAKIFYDCDYKIYSSTAYYNIYIYIFILCKINKIVNVIIFLSLLIVKGSKIINPSCGYPAVIHHMQR